MDSTPPTSVKDIYPEGDVTLVVGEEKRPFTVSSAVLRSASPVFHQMFDPGYSEGQALVEEKHVRVPLPEDDPEALFWILCALHSQNDRVSQTLPCPRLSYQMALLSDKYDLTVALKFVARWWVDQPSVTESEELWFLVKSAYLFRDPAGFSKATAVLILNHKGTYSTFADRERFDAHAHVLLRTCLVLEEQRNLARLNLLKILHASPVPPHERYVDSRLEDCNCDWEAVFDRKFAASLPDALQPHNVHLLSLADAIDMAKRQARQWEPPAAPRKLSKSFQCRVTAVGLDHEQQSASYMENLLRRLELPRRPKGLSLEGMISARAGDSDLA